MVSGLESVTARLEAEVAADRMVFDGSQRAAAQRLDALRETLRSNRPSSMNRLRAALPWFPGLAARTPPRGLYLWGGVGRGKTLLMDLFFAALPTRGTQGGAERSHFYRFMRAVHAELAGIKNRSRPLDLVAQRVASRVRVICLDEFFVSDIADAMLLAGLFDGLFRRGVALVATSNLPPQELYKDGLQRQRFLPAIDLILANVEVIHLDGGVDYRLRQLTRAPTYLDSARPDTATALEQRFATLAGADAAAGPAKLRIEGRDLEIVKSAGAAVWFEFSALCDGPRSQNDYIELARLYPTIIIANIPRFDRTREDAARRFVMLIDEFYDRNVKILVSAAAPPTELYRGERLRFEFERTVSRLIEMQTQAYLAAEHRP